MNCHVSAEINRQWADLLDDCRICGGDGCSACEPFNDQHVEGFIAEFATTEGIADRELWDMGFHDEPADAELFRQLCRSWIADREAVHRITGTHFWRTAKEMAQQVFDYRNE